MAEAAKPSAGGEKAIREALEIAREALGMDAGYVAEFSEGEQIYRETAGDAESFAMREGEGYPIDGSYCKRMVMGDIPNVVGDSSAEESVRDLALTELGSIGAYVGVPITFSDGRVYGTVCAISHEKRDNLTDRDVLVLKAVAKLMGSELERDALEAENTRLERRVGELEEELTEIRESLQLAESNAGEGDFVDARGWRPD